jgi:hypothetical protein
MMVGCWVLIASLQKLVLVRHRPLAEADGLDLMLSDYVCMGLTHMSIFARQWMIGRFAPVFKTIANDLVTNGTRTDVCAMAEELCCWPVREGRVTAVPGA